MEGANPAQRIAPGAVANSVGQNAWGVASREPPHSCIDRHTVQPAMHAAPMVHKTSRRWSTRSRSLCLYTSQLRHASMNVLPNSLLSA
eukprot:6177794-Pleurochrysis_carterae.AAC.2